MIGTVREISRVFAQDSSAGVTSAVDDKRKIGPQLNDRDTGHRYPSAAS